MKRRSSSEALEDGKVACVSFFSGLFHSMLFEIRKQTSPFENGMFIMSVDVDVGSKELGIINKGRNDLNISHWRSEYEIGELEELTIPYFVKLFDKYEMAATFAVRGQLAEVSDSVLAVLLKSRANHEICAHGYYHKKFRNLSYNEAETEIKMISQGMRKFGLTPRSFVFPRNSVAHLKLLERYGYECYRDYSNFMHDSMCIKKHGELWEVHPSLLIDKHTKFTFLKRILDIAVRRRLPMHLWFHARDFGEESGEIKRNAEKVFVPLFSYAETKKRDGLLTSETMLSATRKARVIL